MKIEITFWGKEWDELTDDEIKLFCQNNNIRQLTEKNTYIVKRMYSIKRKTIERIETIIENIRCSTFHMDNEQAIEVIDGYIKTYPELLKYHTKEWYHINC